MLDVLEKLLADARAARSLPDPALRRLLRERAGLTQGQLASAVGVSRPSVTRWESGIRSPRAPARARYVEVLERLAAEGER
jgi:transcriptional regulator with XRE-family HTH domain